MTVEVCFDSQTFLRQRVGGISRLFTDLVAQFDADPGLGVHAVLPFSVSNNSYARRDLPSRSVAQTPEWLPRGLLYVPHWLRGARFPRAADIVHHTYYSRRFLAKDGRWPQVTTVYDMIPELFAGTSDATATHLQKRDYVATCDLVICISESTRQDMENFYGSIARRTVTIPLAVRPGFAPNLPPPPGLPQEYVLYVGKRAGYKDFGVLPQATALLRDAGLATPVVVVGDPWSADERRQLEQLGLMDAFHQVALGDADLRRAYSNSALVVQTSRYEGFGLTPLEGMASGAPVVIADASSMPEVGGDVARYFSPGDAVSLAEAMRGILADGALRAELGRRGIERAAGFTTRLMAERTAAAYRLLVS